MTGQVCRGRYTYPPSLGSSLWRWRESYSLRLWPLLGSGCNISSSCRQHNLESAVTPRRQHAGFTHKNSRAFLPRHRITCPIPVTARHAIPCMTPLHFPRGMQPPREGLPTHPSVLPPTPHGRDPCHVCLVQVRTVPAILHSAAPSAIPNLPAAGFCEMPVMAPQAAGGLKHFMPQCHFTYSFPLIFAAIHPEGICSQISEPTACTAFTVTRVAFFRIASPT